MSSGCSSGGCCFFFFFFDDAGVWITALVTATLVVTAVISTDITFFGVASADVISFVSAIVTVVMVVDVDDLTGDIFCPLYGLPGSTPLLCGGGPQFLG